MTQFDLIHEIVAKVADFYGIDADDLYHGRRIVDSLCQIRHVAMFIVSQVTQLPDDIVAGHFGLVRSSAMHARASVLDRLDDAYFQDEIDALRSSCLSDGAPKFTLYFNPEELLLSAFYQQARRSSGPSKEFSVSLANSWSSLPRRVKDAIRAELRKAHTFDYPDFTVDETDHYMFRTQGAWGPIRNLWGREDRRAA